MTRKRLLVCLLRPTLLLVLALPLLLGQGCPSTGSDTSGGGGTGTGAPDMNIRISGPDVIFADESLYNPTVYYCYVNGNENYIPRWTLSNGNARFYYDTAVSETMRAEVMGVAVGTVTLTAEITDISYWGTRTLTQSKTIKVAALTISGPDQVAAGQQAVYTAVLNGATTDDIDLRWESPDSRTATLSTTTGAQTTVSIATYPWYDSLGLWICAYPKDGPSYASSIACFKKGIDISE